VIGCAGVPLRSSCGRLGAARFMSARASRRPETPVVAEILAFAIAALFACSARS